MGGGVVVEDDEDSPTSTASATGVYAVDGVSVYGGDGPPPYVATTGSACGGAGMGGGRVDG